MSGGETNADPVKAAVELLTTFKNAVLSDSPVLTADLLTNVKKVVTAMLGAEFKLPTLLSDCRDPGDVKWMKASKYTNAEEWEADVRQSINAILTELEKEMLIFPNHDVVRHVSDGGFGQVFEVKHKHCSRRFAIKVLNPFGGQRDVDRSRFIQEAEMLFDLDHQYIVKVYDLGTAGSKAYIVMEYVEGKNLNAIIVERGRIDPLEAMQIVLQVASALQHSHEHGIIHRDLKLSNVILGTTGTITVVDFGLGIYVEAELNRRLTKADERAAGGNHTGPELLNNPKLVDSRSDIYSIGAIWFEMVTGSSPAGSGLAETLRNVAGLSIEHQAAILRCLDVVEKRYQSCTELIEEIRKADELDFEGDAFSDESVESDEVE